MFGCPWCRVNSTITITLGTYSHVLPALRALFSQRPEVTNSEPETLCVLLYTSGTSPTGQIRPAVEAALEALEVEGMVVA